MDDGLPSKLVPGARVRVTQQIAGSDYSWASAITGTVIEYSQQETGSWFAHSKNDRLWLDRLVLRKEDGEITTLNLDDYSVLEVLSAPSSTAPAASKAATDPPA